MGHRLNLEERVAGEMETGWNLHGMHKGGAWWQEARSPAFALSFLVCLCCLWLDFSHPLWALAILLGLIFWLFLAAFFPRWSFYLSTKSSGNHRHPGVSLTFDDGPDPLLTPLLLKTLARHGISATFFVVGSKAQKHQGLIAAIAAAGHEIGNHTWGHDPFLVMRSTGRIAREIVKCHELLLGLGVPTGYFRPPLGITNPRILHAMNGLDLQCICFSCRAFDFGNRRIKHLARRLLTRVRPGAIVLLHDCQCGPAFDAQKWIMQIEQFIVGVKQMGMAFIPLKTMLQESDASVAFSQPQLTGMAGASVPE